VSSWQILSAKEQTYQFGFFDKKKKKEENFEMPSVLD
jgi:hypothetical protein